MLDDLLGQIVSATRATVAARRVARPLADVERAAAAATPDAAAFREALARPDGVNVIAECKRRSPLKGLLRADYDAADLARRYEAGGAAAISVLTEPSFFEGAIEHLADVRRAVSRPVLRKDFVIDPYQLAEARAAGADAVLLIVAVLGEHLAAYVRTADAMGLAAVVEVHDLDELDRAIETGARIVGVNSRNLRTMTVDADTCVDLASRLPRGMVAVAESGIRTASDIARLRGAGYSAFLVGEHLVRSDDPAGALRELTCT